ncbi:acyltransferase family protein [Massilia sp. PAMC28688]|uniref:acyltransferase family protein n=1 Tax=Massilia sp. PAMC28688 TaxID=2861283 RepID=UPI001C634739|nr:acyltransferase family protein [Massilia sp. PAMC28688]QYF93525.1 acyltransferase family protein [Massilia sp. PAMC28688]
MNTPSLPRLRLLDHSQLDEDTWHSFLISLLRGLAALQVAAAHLRADFFPGLRSLDDPALWYQALAFATGFAHQAVLVFFLVSGWLVGGSFLNKMAHPDALKMYAIDRVTRLWTVLVPTFLLILAFGIVSGALDPRHADFGLDNPYSVSAFAGNLLGLQTITVPQFGGNFPLWSLANESWYYLMFPLLVLALTGRARRSRLLLGSLLGGAVLLLPVAITLYFSIWLLGAGFSRVRLECGAITRATLLTALLGLSVYFRLFGSNDDLVAASYPQDLLLSVLFLLFLSSTVTKAPPASLIVRAVKPWATTLSNFSFTLYVVHIPVMDMLAWLGRVVLGKNKLAAASVGDLAIFLAMLAVVVLFSYGFYRLFEARTYRVRRWLKSQLTKKPLPGVAAAGKR